MSPRNLPPPAIHLKAAVTCCLMPKPDSAPPFMLWRMRQKPGKSISAAEWRKKIRKPASSIEDKRQIYAFINSDGPAWLELPAGPSAADTQLPCIDFGSARFTVIPVNALAHPELIVAQAKKGCDLAVVFAERISDELGRLAGVRTIDNMAVAVCTKAGTNLWMPPEGHKRWEMLSTCPKDGGRILLDTRKTRQKRFHDRVDFDCLFGMPLKE